MKPPARTFVLATLLALGAPLVGAPASAGAKVVAIEDNVFTPRRLSVALGGTVTWRSKSGSTAHNIRQDRKIFRSGAPTTESIDYSRRFSAGSFHYYCEIHGFTSGGMDGIIKVRPGVVDIAGDGFRIQWATSSSNTGSRFDVDYRVGTGAWKVWKRSASQLKATFGVSASPVVVKSGVRYSFRARSIRNGNASRWSPALHYTP